MLSGKFWVQYKYLAVAGDGATTVLYVSDPMRKGL